jgi:hypothetical protein
MLDKFFYEGVGSELVVVTRSLLWTICGCEEMVIVGRPHLKWNVCILYLLKTLLLDNYKTCDAKIRNLFTGPVEKEIIAAPLISSIKEDKVWFGRMYEMGVIRLHLDTI